MPPPPPTASEAAACGGGGEGTQGGMQGFTAAQSFSFVF